jgi:hypothetical protein
MALSAHTNVKIHYTRIETRSRVGMTHDRRRPTRTPGALIRTRRKTLPAKIKQVSLA